jgi:hypothetical protein
VPALRKLEKIRGAISRRVAGPIFRTQQSGGNRALIEQAELSRYDVWRLRDRRTGGLQRFLNEPLVFPGLVPDGD